MLRSASAASAGGGLWLLPSRAQAACVVAGYLLRCRGRPKCPSRMQLCRGGGPAVDDFGHG
eukprot:8512342-Pyramimonas_sp.AAC.1